MKRFLILLVVVLFAATAFAGSAPETEEVTEITVLATSTVDSWDFAYAIDRFHEDYPDVEVVMIALDLSDASTVNMQALLAAGIPPNLYCDYLGRVGQYMVPEYAYPLNDDVTDLDKYIPSYIEACTVDGDVLGLPVPGGAQGMLINLDIMNEIGFTVEWDWTVDDFLEMAELVKQKYGGEKWATALFAGRRSGDYLINNWFPVFGAQFFADGDYTKSAIRETGGEKTHEFFQLLISEGYVQDGVAMRSDYDSYLSIGRGEVAATGFFEGWMDNYHGLAAQYFDERGEEIEPFDYVFMPFPTATGNPTPTSMSTPAIVVANTGTAADAIAARLAQYLNDNIVQQGKAGAPGFAAPNRTDVVVPTNNPHVAEINKIAELNGVMDIGLSQPWFNEVRSQHFIILQEVANFTMTPAESILEYERRVNAILADWASQ